MKEQFHSPLDSRNGAALDRCAQIRKCGWCLVMPWLAVCITHFFDLRNMVCNILQFRTIVLWLPILRRVPDQEHHRSNRLYCFQTWLQRRQMQAEMYRSIPKHILLLKIA